ncbi:carboxymuconolactone decarboxylase family protein [Nocardioides sp.]|uniref:carboxymuconolactone decarboxylase family protein n=1 Tax=Nocardioides sp. TaxID=35761 RepID=UPI00351363D7
MSGSAPRLAPGTLRDIGPLVAGFARVAGRVQGTEPPAVFLTLGRHRRLFWGWLHFAGRLMPGGRLSRRESELVILRVAARRGSAYELTQHRRLGRRAGLGADQVEAIERIDAPGGVRAVGFSARELVLLRVADELVETRDLGGDTWTEVERHFDERERIEVLMLAAHYDMLATVLHTLRVAPDRPRR